MSDDTTTTETETTETEAAPEATEETTATDLSPEALRKELDKVRKEAAKYRTELRAAEPFVAKAKELEEANKTEAQKLAERLAEAEANGTTSAQRLMRLEAAIKGRLFDENGDLDMDLVDRLRGDTAEALEADAKALGARFARPTTTATPSPGRKPTPRLDSARPNPGATDDEKDPKKIAAQALKGYL